MRIVHGWKGLEASDRGAAVAYGNFDGVHRGHQKVIAQAAKAAQALKAPLGVISFDPHPRQIFQPDAPTFRIMKTDQQARALAALGVDIFHVLPFDREMADLTDHEFASQVLAAGLGVRHVAVGFDVSFGKGRTGSPELMAAYGRELGFTVSVAEALGDGQVKFSSTGVREALREGRPQDAAAILGRPFAIEGVVERGRQLGRTLGFPTANLRFPKTPALSGIYATWVHGVFEQPWPSVSSFGTRPTVEGVEPLLEAHLFDFNGDLYGRHIEVEFVAKLRDEEKFNDLPALTEQMHRDAEQARRILNEHRLRATA